MSRIGKKPIAIPAGVEVKVDGSKVTVKGPKGTLENTFNSEINIALEGNEIIVTRPTDDKNHRARDLAFVSKLSEAYTANAVLAKISMWAAADFASVILSC